MRKLINKLTGGEMWVADSREKEYLEAGHKPAPGITDKAASLLADMKEKREEIKAAVKAEAERPKAPKQKTAPRKGRK